jgi:hypothetical protein
MGILKFKGNLINFDKRGFILNDIIKPKKSYHSAFKFKIPKLSVFRQPKRRIVARPKKVYKPTRQEQSPRDFFFRTNKMSRIEKFEDLLETSSNTKPATTQNIKQWKKNPRNSDIEGVDTANVLEAQTLQPKQPTFKRKFAKEYKQSGGDTKSYKTNDKSFEDTISDEAMFEMESEKYVMEEL